MNTTYKSCCQPQEHFGHGFHGHHGHPFNRPLYFDTIPSPNAFKFKPRVDISETSDFITFEFELPGIEMKDIKVQINDDNVLTVTGEKKYYESQLKVLKNERYFGKFSRSFELTDSIDSSKIEAKFTDGILTVTVQKKQPVKPKSTEIEIK